jgi:hypothetical protein
MIKASLRRLSNNSVLQGFFIFKPPQQKRILPAPILVKVAGGTPATAFRRSWSPTDRNMVNEIFIFK